jgi:hypothetical protein
VSDADPFPMRHLFPARVDIKKLLANPVSRRRLMVPVIVATQAREGIETSTAQAEAAYDKVQSERRASNEASTQP